MRKEFPLANMKLKKIFKATVLTRLGLLPVSREDPFKRGASPADVEGRRAAHGLSHRSEDWGPPAQVPTTKSCKHSVSKKTPPKYTKPHNMNTARKL